MIQERVAAKEAQAVQRVVKKTLWIQVGRRNGGVMTVVAIETYFKDCSEPSLV